MTMATLLDQKNQNRKAQDVHTQEVEPSHVVKVR